jgi:hypothetical protein
MRMKSNENSDYRCCSRWNLGCAKAKRNDKEAEIIIFEKIGIYYC